MLINASVEIRGCSPKTSKKGNAYNVVALEQGVDTITIMTDLDIRKLTEDKGKTVIGLFEYNPIYKGLTLVNYELAN